jgi:NAD(P)-dependent dehydrogenase (short-subunit alcohol dehydrogenase family)
LYISVAFVTGAGGTVGRATILQFARDGVTKIAGLDIAYEALTESEKILRQEFSNVNFLPIVADLTEVDQVENAIQRTVREFGRLDHAVNNAGVGQKLGPTGETSEQEFEIVLRVNLKGLWNCEKFELQQMEKQEALPTSS